MTGRVVSPVGGSGSRQRAAPLARILIPLLSGAPLAAQSASDSTPFCCDRKRFGTAAAEMAALEVVPWYFNLYFSDDSTAVLSPASWWRNIEQGFEWDVDNFRTNMFMHPVHGHLYFNVARANGYDFWESAAFPWIGSFLFEFFGERNRPAINDWISTSASGVVIGESLFRASRLILDNRATGFERAWRELSAFLINPSGGINRLFRGEMSRVGPNPADRFPAGFGYLAKLGFRAVGEGNLDIENDGLAAFGELHVQYGDPSRPFERPFDDFLLALQLNSKDSELFGRLQVEGSLHRADLQRTENTTNQFSVTLHYDYINNETYEVGGQSIGLGVISRFRLAEPWSIATRGQVVGSLIAGVGSEYADLTGRSYDFGSGAGLRLYGMLFRDRAPILEAFYVGSWVHSLNGASGNHLIHFSSLAGYLPIRPPFGLGAEVILAVRNSYYRDFADVHRRNPQLRLFATVGAP